jgi:response regulator of citrate/malate metabolism
MSQGLNVIIVDDDPVVCSILEDYVKGFYTWGDLFVFSDVDEAITYCQNCDFGLAIFIVDVFLFGKSGFYFLDAVEENFPAAHEDAIMITGNASEDVVNMCVASDVHYLLEKPVKRYALQLAIRSIVMKYVHFSKRLMADSEFARIVERI